ncbi:MAG TPA: glycolate oxidase subunit GlcF [Burkholderiales bacterium]|nr:glycolate oxidase subunit GlcF [Burkholderiales bacterium]
MQTNLADFIRDTPDGRDADAILRKCVHCGFCTATCPTYQILGDELDGPRGRIYLMKQVLEGAPVTGKTQLHLDRCLTCRSCETTCPSGVHYSRLLDIGRRVVDERVKRGPADTFVRAALRAVVPRPVVFEALVNTARMMRPLLPRALQEKVPREARPAPALPATSHARRMLVLRGCVQPVLSPATNVAAARVLHRLGITLEAAQGAGCCGGVSYHLTAEDEARGYMRRNVDAWWPHVEAGVEAIVITASGCGTMVKDYGHHLARDARYAEKAARISELTRDISEVILAEADALTRLARTPRPTKKVAFHPPCTLQHGLKIRGEIERLLLSLGVDLVPVRDAHLCCGSAGTYSLLHPDLAGQLRDNKLAALTAGDPAEIVTANIGCQNHLQQGTDKPVRHWIELVDDLLSAR